MPDYEVEFLRKDDSILKTANRALKILTDKGPLDLDTYGDTVNHLISPHGITIYPTRLEEKEWVGARAMLEEGDSLGLAVIEEKEVRVLDTSVSMGADAYVFSRPEDGNNHDNILMRVNFGDFNLGAQLERPETQGTETTVKPDKYATTEQDLQPYFAVVPQGGSYEIYETDAPNTETINIVQLGPAEIYHETHG